VVFLHGYNVTFIDAARRAAQIGYDLQIGGAMAFFSWPSQGAMTPQAYAADAASIEASEGAIADFLAAFAAQSGPDHVHVIAHSMGNRGLLRAMQRMVTDAQRSSGRLLGQLILAAPDVDSTVFCDLARTYRHVAARTTLYVSDRDRALGASTWLHGFPRAGYTPPVTVIPDIDTVHVANVDLTRLGHGYVAEARDVLHDMHALLRFDAPPHSRMGLRPMRRPIGASMSNRFRPRARVIRSRNKRSTFIRSGGQRAQNCSLFPRRHPADLRS
jgi:esterase/lipase superfamily enzyme